MALVRQMVSLLRKQGDWMLKIDAHLTGSAMAPGMAAALRVVNADVVVGGGVAGGLMAAVA